jgi:hypothetical protein
MEEFDRLRFPFALPDLSKPLAKANSELIRYVYEAFQFTVELDATRPRYE